MIKILRDRMLCHKWVNLGVTLCTLCNTDLGHLC